MRTKAWLFIPLAALLLGASGPIYQHKDVEIQREFQNIYDSLKSLKVGTKTNDRAASGYIGEFSESYITVPVNAPGNAVFGDITSITLTAGDWDLSCLVVCALSGATMTTWQGGMALTSGTSASGMVNGVSGSYGLPPTSATDSSITVSSWRQSLATTTTIYLKCFAGYSAGTPKFYGSIRARRVR